jgi:hypothetical protein
MWIGGQREPNGSGNGKEKKEKKRKATTPSKT